MNNNDYRDINERNLIQNPMPGRPYPQGPYMPSGAYMPGGQKPQRQTKQTGFAQGVIVGILVGIVIMASGALFGLSGLIRAGYIHIGTNGEIYVQGSSVTDKDGIGSDVEAKLNALDSLMDSFYFDDVDEEEAKTNIYKAYLNSFKDKYTVYYNEDEYKTMMESTKGTFYGVGAVCQKSEEGGIVLVDVYENAPGYAAGLRDGDRIVEVDGVNVTDMDLSAAVALIKGERGTTVNLKAIRGKETLEFTVTRDKVDAVTVEYEMKEGQIGYIYISQFDDVTTQQFKEAVDDLEKQGMKGLVLDIRDNPGGVLTTVVDMLDYILPDGLIVYTEDKYGKRTEYNGKNEHELNIPIAVLVNNNSASASEIFAGAIQDYEKGVIIGTQTFGKGIVQTIRPLTDGSAVKFTIAKYFTPKGQDIHGKGVTPDKVVEADHSAETDNQLDAALEEVRSKAAN